MSQSDDVPPPKRDCEMNQIPELEVGQKVRVQTTYNSDPDRTLTVEEVGAESEQTDNLEITTDDTQVVLSGYGTEYRLGIDRSWTDAWQRVVMWWPSRETGVSVSSIEVGVQGDSDE